MMKSQIVRSDWTAEKAASSVRDLTDCETQAASGGGGTGRPIQDPDDHLSPPPPPPPPAPRNN